MVPYCVFIGASGDNRLPFEDDLALQLHYLKHRNEFSFPSEIEYQAAADEFMASPLEPPARECVRPDGDRVRFNRRDRFFAVQAPSGWLKTFHRPSCKRINQAFFNWECGRTETP